MKILIIEDDENLAKSISSTLKKHSIQSDIATSGEVALDFLGTYSHSYDLILLDIILPDTSGFDFLKSIRKNAIKTPILVVSSLDDYDNKINILNQGADDYLTKPFNKDELVARVNAVIRRAKGYSDSIIKIHDLEVNLNSKQALVHGKIINLTSKEYSVLQILALKQGKPVSKSIILDQLYDGMNEPEPKIIDVFICKLRNKIKKQSSQNYIKTIWGQGYVLADPTK